MKILITGSSGFVGTSLVKRLSKKHRIIEYDLVKGFDIRNRKQLNSKIKNVDLVIHLAALISAPESWKKPEEYFETNVMGTLKVVLESIENKVDKLLFFSSAAAVSQPQTPYGKTKKIAEEIIKLYSDKVNYLIIRPENIYGPNQKASYGYVIHNFIKSALGDEDLLIYGDGKQERDFIYIDDVIDVVEKMIKKEFDGSVISLGTGRSININKLARKIILNTGSKSKIRYLEKREEPRKSVAHLSKLLKKGIDPKKFKKLENGIKDLKRVQYSRK